MYTTIVAVAGILLLIAIAIGVGASLDTKAQQAAGRAATGERRQRNEELRAQRAAEQRLRDEWVRLTEERQRLRGETLRNGRSAKGPAEFDQNRVALQMLAYASIVAVVPFLAWLILVAPHWM
jgi:uncharacterized protein HemX